MQALEMGSAPVVAAEQLRGVSATAGRRTGKNVFIAAGAAFVALVALLSTLLAPPAQANTPSTWSARFGIDSSYGWTNDHAWAIVSYADAISYGSGEVAGFVCGVVSGEAGPFNPVSKACGSAVQSAVSQIVAGHPRLTNHGLWVAVYLWPYHETSGTW